MATIMRVRANSPRMAGYTPVASPTSRPGSRAGTGIHAPRRHAEFETYLNALLADLQNTISPHGSAAGSNYGSLNGSASRSQRHYAASPTPATNHYPPQSPTYQNQRVVQETVTKSSAYPAHGYSSSGYGSRPGSAGAGKTPSLNNNLSELDTLLQDLSNARYSEQMDRRDVSVLDGSATSPGYGTTNSKSLNDTFKRPSVDSLLEELNTAVPNGDGIYHGSGNAHTLPRQVTITVKETTTETTGAYPPPATTANRTETLSRSNNYVTSTPAHPGGGPAASSATKELDDLMATLSDFKINAGSHQHQTIVDSPYAKPNKATKQQTLYSSTTTTSSVVKQNQLDSMLGNLQADMSRQGITTTQKGCCNACDKPIVGQVITALGKTWHPEHFTCTHCTQELGTRNFFERDGHPYCEPDYHNLFSPRCAYCNGPILDKCVTALEKTWHTEHFFCAQCGKQFGEEGFHEREGKPYCRDDYFDMFAPKCGGCNRAIMENYISALNTQWHPDCFVCRDCKKPVQGKSFYAMEGKPVCPKCVGVDEEGSEEDE